MLENIGSYITIGLVIGIVISIIIKSLFSYLAKTISKPIKKKEYGLRCSELSFSYKTVAEEKDEEQVIVLSKNKRNTADEGSCSLAAEKYVIVDARIRIKNNGKQDLEAKDIYRPLTIKAPEYFIFTNDEPETSKSKIGLHSKIDENDNSVITNTWDLFKAGDSFDLKISAKAPAKYVLENQIKSFFDSLQFEIYAKNIDKVDKSQSLNDRKDFGIKILFCFAVIFSGSLSLMYYKNLYESLNPLLFSIEIINPDTIQGNTVIQNAIVAYDPSTDSIKCCNDSVSIQISIEAFKNNVKVTDIDFDETKTSKIHKYWIDYRSQIVLMTIFIVLGSLLLPIFIVFNYIKNIR